MKKLDKLVNAIRKGVEEEIRSSISAGMNTANYEYDFGNTTIMVEVELVGYGLVVQINDVWVERDHSEHNSPMVIDAIKQALPDWVTIARDIEEENQLFEMEDKCFLY